MHHTLTLQDGELTLRPLNEADIDTLCALALEHAQQLSKLGTPPNTPEYYRLAIENPHHQSFVIEVDGKVAGNTRFGDIDHNNGSLEIGWTWLDPQYYGTGINRRMKRLMLTYAFEQMGIERVQFRTDILNTRSQRAIEKLGATKEGILRSQQRRANGTLRDTVFYSILLTEWPEVKKQLDAHP